MPKRLAKRSGKPPSARFADAASDAELSSQDEMDRFEEERDRVLLDGEEDEEEGEDALFALPDGDEPDSDEELLQQRLEEYQRGRRKIITADDDEKEEAESEEEEEAWGLRGDYVQAGEEVDVEEEAEEARRIQALLADQLDVDDVEVDVVDTGAVTADRDVQAGEVAVKERLADVVSLLEELGDVEKTLKQFEPLEKLVAEGRLPAGPASSVILLQQRLGRLYMTNASFYLLLRSKGLSVKRHPVVKRMVQIKKLIAQHEPFLEQLAPELQVILDSLAMGQFELLNFGGVSRVRRDVPLADAEMEVASNTADVVSQHDTADGKHAATWKMIANKGTTPYRKKEVRNPRVKYRNKWEKMKVRRRGQVREYRDGHKQAYHGEVSGIKAGVKHSRKFKS